MTLQAQIELITVPQEFTRLCNSLLIAEHGDDFLPIDDDRADRGNDGFLKSERRLFAAHCFKRPQNRSLDALIRSKMVGDLGKAIALKRADIWPIDAWTFLANYPITDEIGAEISRIGREAGIDVAWRGPDFFATALARHPEVAETFPGLHMVEVSEKLAELQDALSTPPTENAAVGSWNGLPQTNDEKRELLERRPPAWEYLLFAGVMSQRRRALEPKWRDQELRIPSRTRRYIEADEVAGYLSRSFGRLGALIEPMTRVFADQQAVFGAPGEPGDPVRIEHFANWLMDAFEDMMNWGAELRATDAPENFERTLELAAMAVDRPLGEIRDFIDKIVSETERIPDHLALSEAERERNPLVIEATLVVSLDQDLMDETLEELKRALSRCG